MVFKHKKYNEQADKQFNVPLSQIVSKNEYDSKKREEKYSSLPPAERGEESDKRNVYRKNLYVSKQAEEINKDFKNQALIRNAASISEDTPYHFQGPTKFYTQDFNDLMKQYKASQKALPKTDIFGQNLPNHPKIEDIFEVKPPHKGQVYDTKKMALVEKMTPEDMNAKVSHVKLRWPEEPSKQHYERFVCDKIGATRDPFIKSLKEKETFRNTLLPYPKIGENVSADRLKQPKPMELKIGHPNSEYSYTKKGREDGFYGNRKVIEGENYTRSNFFV